MYKPETTERKFLSEHAGSLNFISH